MRAGLAALGLAAVVGGCSAAGADAPVKDPRSALPRASELPGGGWTLIGTTDRRPAAGDTSDPLDGAEGIGDRCRHALDALDAATSSPSPSADAGPFARAVYRSGRSTPGPNDRDLSVSIESAQVASARAGAIGQVTDACTKPMTTKAGAQDLTVRITRARYTTPGAVGYTVTYDTDGLEHYFDMVVVPAGADGVTASTTGPDAAADRALLDAAVTQTLGRLRPGQAPTTG